MIAVPEQSNAPVKNLTPLANVSVSELPPDFQDLLDPAKPLTVEQFAPRVVNSPFWSLLLFPCAPFVVGSVGLIVTAESFLRIALGLIFALPLIPLVWLMYWVAVRRSRYVRRVRCNELRLGVFVHPDALLVRLRENLCFLLPKDFVRRVIFERYTHVHRMYNSAGPTVSAVRLIFFGSDGKEYRDIVGMNAFGTADRFEHYDDLMGALRRWKPELEIGEV